MTQPITDWAPTANTNQSPPPAPAQPTKPVPRALHLYLRVLTDPPGKLKGGITRKEWGKDWFEVVSVILRFDGTVEVVKAFDLASEAFVRAQTRGDLLPTVEIELADQYDHVRKRVVLSNALISDDTKVTTFDGQSQTTWERIAFNAKKIRYLWTNRDELRAGWTVAPR
jgi:hypothetical protein